MKTKIIALFAVVLCLTAFSLTSFKIVTDYSGATVEDQSGIKIFCYSKPIAKYDILGMAKVKGMVSSEKGSHMIELLIENAKKNYPSGQGIIVASDFEKAEVIKFKD